MVSTGNVRRLRRRHRSHSMRRCLRCGWHMRNGNGRGAGTSIGYGFFARSV